METVLDESNAALLAQCAFESNSIYVYDNTEKDKDHIVASWYRPKHRYQNFTPTSEDAYLHAVETPPISDQLQAMVLQVQTALPNILGLTNQLAAVLSNSVVATSNLNADLAEARPLLTNFTGISDQLKVPGGVLTWALGTNGSEQLQDALTHANATLAGTDTNLTAILFHLADITSNLNMQVQENTNMLGSISKIVTDADDLVQGLKKTWFLRSAFKKENQKPAKK